MPYTFDFLPYIFHMCRVQEKKYELHMYIVIKTSKMIISFRSALSVDLLFSRCEGIYTGSNVMDLVIMAPKRFAVFGDSYVSRQGRFGMQMHFGDGSKVKYFGLGGMRAGDVDAELWKKLIRYRPNVCLLHLGGNDITRTCVVKDLFKKVWDLVTKLQELGCHVVVGEVLPRAEGSLRGVSLDIFERVRTALNRKLRRVLKENFLFFRVCHWYPLGPDGGLHYHYDRDGVHLSKSGMRQYHDTLQTEFFNYIY